MKLKDNIKVTKYTINLYLIIENETIRKYETKKCAERIIANIRIMNIDIEFIS